MKELLTKKGFHITHNDSDAVGCALVAALAYPELNLEDTTYFCTIGPGPSEAVRKIFETFTIDEIGLIIISDISVDDDALELLNDARSKGVVVVGYDHHVTNTANQKYDWFVVDSERHYDDMRYGKDGYLQSATLLMAKQLHMLNKSSALDKIVDDISRYDIWEWKNHPFERTEEYSEDIVSVYTKFVGVRDTFNELLDYFNTNRLFEEKSEPYPESFKWIYYIQKRKEKETCERAPMYAKNNVFEFNGTMLNAAYYICNNEHSNAVADYINTNFPEIDLTIILYPESRKVGFRSKKEHVNCSLIAKELGGGGHPGASGATINNIDDFIKFLNVVYTSEGLVVKDANPR